MIANLVLEQTNTSTNKLNASPLHAANHYPDLKSKKSPQFCNDKPDISNLHLSHSDKKQLYFMTVVFDVIRHATGQANFS